MEHNIVVTGMGLVTPLGIGKEENFKALVSSRSAVLKEKEGFLGARIRSIPVHEELKLLSFSFLACAEALNQSRILCESENMGSTLSVSKPNIYGLYKNSKWLLNAFDTSALSSQIAKVFKIKGPLRSITAACATGTNSIIIASEWIKRGICDVVLCGASESSFHPLYYSSFLKMGVLAKNTACPYDLKREGFAMGEGSGILVIESERHAILRNAKVLARVAGYSMSNEVLGTTSLSPEGESISCAIKHALKRSKLTKVDYINTHGTGTRINDMVETKAIKDVFKNDAYEIYLSSTKASTGHLLGASGAVELIFCIMAMERGVVFPTLNLYSKDPECDLNYTPNKPVYCNLNTSMSLSFGFGGQIGVIVLKKTTE